MSRFFIPPEYWDPQRLILGQEEAHHCTRVLRHEVGDRVSVFNGMGAEASAEIVELRSGEVVLKTLSAQKSAPFEAEIAIGQAIPKGKNMDLIVQKATELGASAIYPLISERTIIRLTADEAEKRREKWQRVALEACKQSGQNWLPEVATPVSPADFFNGSLKRYQLKLVASLEPDARDLRSLLAERDGDAPPEKAIVLIGPEGDFTPAEVNGAKGAGCQPLGLGPIVLRTETAAIHALSILGYELR